jgi:hypothetical protein
MQADCEEILGYKFSRGEARYQGSKQALPAEAEQELRKGRTKVGQVDSEEGDKGMPKRKSGPQARRGQARR